MHITQQMRQPISKLAHALGKAAEQSSSKRKADPDAKSSAILLPVFSTKPMRVIFAAILFLLLATSVFFVANHHAKKTARGFPNFQDYQINLVNEANKPQTVADFANQPVALFFGFTYCPDICPTTLTTLAAARDDLQIAGVNTDSLRIVFVTVDPLRDTPEQLAAYLSLFGMPVTALTGDAEALLAAQKTFGIYAERVEDDDGVVLWDHSAAVYLYDKSGAFGGTILFEEPAEFVLQKMQRLLR